MPIGPAGIQQITPSAHFAARNPSALVRGFPRAAAHDSYAGSRRHKEEDGGKKFLGIFPHPGEWLRSALSRLNPITIVKTWINDSLSQWQNKFSSDLDENIRKTFPGWARNLIKYKHPDNWLPKLQIP